MNSALEAIKSSCEAEIARDPKFALDPVLNEMAGKLQGQMCPNNCSGVGVCEKGK